MAIIKAVSSKAPINTVIDYVTQEEKVEDRLVTGFNCNVDTAKKEMQTTKQLWNKTNGRTYKHFIQSFSAKVIIMRIIIVDKKEKMLYNNIIKIRIKIKK